MAAGTGTGTGTYTVVGAAGGPKMTDCVAGGMLGAGVGTSTGGGGGGGGGAGLLHPEIDTRTSDEAVAGGCSPPRGLTRAVRSTWCSCACVRVSTRVRLYSASAMRACSLYFVPATVARNNQSV
jgi:hypothetical protein